VRLQAIVGAEFVEALGEQGSRAEWGAERASQDAWLGPEAVTSLQ